MTSNRERLGSIIMEAIDQSDKVCVFRLFCTEIGNKQIPYVKSSLLKRGLPDAMVNDIRYTLHMPTPSKNSLALLLTICG